MHPAAARVGPSNEPSVRTITARFSSGATICIENTIKVLFLSVGSTIGETTLPTLLARSGPSSSATDMREENPLTQRDRKTWRTGRGAVADCYPPKNWRRLRNFGDVWV